MAENLCRLIAPCLFGFAGAVMAVIGIDRPKAVLAGSSSAGGQAIRAEEGSWHE